MRIPTLSEILLVEPEYYSQYPSLGLLKLGKMEERRWNDVRLVRGNTELSDFNPQKIYITSLFTYAWKPVHRAIEFYHNQFPEAEILVGGIYATLMPDNIKNSFFFVKIHSGLYPEAENLLPAYHLLKTVGKWKDWNKSIIFTSRGCIRKCPFCIVPKMEGSLNSYREKILDLIHPDHKEVVIWDNNFLASPYAKNILKELRDHDLKADFNQGLDARLMTEEYAGLLADVKSNAIHMAYDWVEETKAIKKAIDLLSEAGYRKRNLIFYVLYNFYDPSTKIGDTPEDFLVRLKNLMNWGVSAYPMRYVPLDSLDKNSFISPNWKPKQLEAIADARRVMGYGGAFVPYKGFVEKINNAEYFEEAMELRPVRNIKLENKNRTQNGKLELYNKVILY